MPSSRAKPANQYFKRNPTSRLEHTKHYSAKLKCLNISKHMRDITSVVIHVPIKVLVRFPYLLKKRKQNNDHAIDTIIIKLDL